MTVKDLIEALQKFPQHATVYAPFVRGTSPVGEATLVNRQDKDGGVMPVVAWCHASNYDEDDTDEDDTDEEVEFEALPTYGEHMAWEKFVEMVECGTLMDDDGSGNLATETQQSDIDISPSELNPDVTYYARPSWATHVVWFNK